MKLIKFKVTILTLSLCFQYAKLSSRNEYYYRNYDWKIQESLKSIPPIELDFIISELAVIKEVTEKQVKYNEDVYLNLSQLIRKYGYDFEEHKVKTEDGYVLGLHRIPRKGPPVFLMHGILQSSDDFVTAGPKSALAYYLANKGYDVWMGNARGNKYSRKNVKLSPKDPRFWNFSWHEIGVYDLPANIDYILENTKRKKLGYVGYSQGTTSFYVLMSERTEYNAKITVQISMSPVSFMSHSFSPILRLLCDLNIFQKLEASSLPEFLPSNFVTGTLCNNDEYMKLLCSNVLLIGFGFNQGQFNVTNLPVILSHMPSGCSTKQLEHYKQCIYSENFRKFDYGVEKNLEVYGSKKPPDYHLDNIQAPIALFFSRSDWISSALDVKTLKNKLPNVIGFYEIKNFNHLDFLYGKNVKEKIYRRIVKLIRSFE